MPQYKIKNKFQVYVALVGNESFLYGTSIKAMDSTLHTPARMQGPII